MPDDLASLVEQSRQQAARTIAEALPKLATLLLEQAQSKSPTRMDAEQAKARAIVFGIMLDQLDKLTGAKQQGRYGSPSPLDTDTPVNLDGLSRWIQPLALPAVTTPSAQTIPLEDHDQTSRKRARSS